MRGITAVNGVTNAVLLLALMAGTTETALAQRGGGFGGFGGAPSEPEVSAPVDTEELRRNYPFRSLKKRLEYEERRTPSPDKPRLSKTAAERLNWRELGKDASPVRASSLKMLHANELKKFVESEWFGVGRVSPGYNWLPPPKDPGRLKLSLAPSSDEEDGPSIELPDERPSEPAVNSWSPSKIALLRFSEYTEDDFASGWTLGYVKSLDEVSGFEPHAFLRKPELNDDWTVSRLELVSLLKQPDARVYVSEYLPRMQDLDEKVTRALTKFESEGLKQLRAGEELHVESKLNAIRMVGAIRANKRCIECHQVQRGELLGAFTYELKRTPPLPVPKRRAI